MNRQILDRLDKVLALADSDQDGEAVSAVRMARQLLSHDGLSFGDLARAAQQRPKANPSAGFFSATQTSFQTELVKLRHQLSDLRGEIQMQDAHLQHWRKRAEECEQQLTAAQEETRRWRQLARDTVEKLWDLSLAVQEVDRDTSPAEAKKSVK